MHDFIDAVVLEVLGVQLAPILLFITEIGLIRIIQYWESIICQSSLKFQMHSSDFFEILFIGMLSNFLY